MPNFLTWQIAYQFSTCQWQGVVDENLLLGNNGFTHAQLFNVADRIPIQHMPVARCSRREFTARKQWLYPPDFLRRAIRKVYKVLLGIGIMLLALVSFVILYTPGIRYHFLLQMPLLKYGIILCFDSICFSFGVIISRWRRTQP
jgi:hypothetical protein